MLCWSQLYWHSTTMWVPIGLNLMVHVFMYYYYAMATLGHKVWWKRHLTALQIAQFIIDVVVCSWATALKVRPMQDHISTGASTRRAPPHPHPRHPTNARAAAADAPAMVYVNSC